jgi:hypothetical protein
MSPHTSELDVNTGLPKKKPAAPSPYTAPSYTAPAAAAPSPSPLTFGSAGTHDSAYDAAVALAARNRDNELAAATGDADLLRRSYGFAGVDDFTIDPNNPFGRAQLLKRQYDQAKEGTQNSYGDRGQQTSGAYVRAQSSNLFRNQQANDALQKDYLQGRAQILARVNAANSQYGSDAINAGLGGLDRALSARDVYQTGGGAAAAKPLASNERIATSKADGAQWVYRLKDGQWLRVRKA